ncbi:oxidoreductase [Serratia fonticola]|uniref:terminase large subunit domain-containing protein n=1 Tax=Serratia TaxID=613 RepID=UPI00192BD9C1|nr:terminase family protein [Serratia fonticola]MBL5864441.1 oxidoreductase [Serratia fonticola]
MKTNVTDPRRQAQTLYWSGYSIPYIAELTGVKPPTLYSWRRRDTWDDVAPLDRARITTEARYQMLISKDVKSGRDFKEIDLLGRQLARFERRVQDEKQAEKKKAPKNHFTDEQITELRALFFNSLYEHQRRWYKYGSKRNRNILKSRQIGATWYFAREALIDALETGRNQIFLSASRAQAHQFRRFIIAFAREIGVELKGDPMVLSNGATLYFLGTSAATAQSYSGNLIFDEYFWTSNFIELRKVAAAMATHSQWRRTYFSTASTEEHEAYGFWTGATIQESKKKADRTEIDVSHKALKNGKACADGQWRQIVTIRDVIDSGFDLVNLDEIMQENSTEDFDNLYMCEFISSDQRPFGYDELIRCGVDAWDPGNPAAWKDWKPYAARPFGDRGVWLGYDPNGDGEGGDSAGLAVLAPPMVKGGKFRVLEAIQLRGMPFEKQADEIRKMTKRYNVQFVGIDGTGIGKAVYQIVKAFYPAAVMFEYSPSVKAALVLKAQMVIRRGRFEYDAGLQVVARSFRTIRKKVTPGGMVTYASDRTKGASHGDVAWAIMHALHNEPIGTESGGTGNSFVTEF